MTHTIHPNDLLYITALNSGMTLLSTQLIGMASLNDILRIIRDRIETIKGIITLRIRNSTQGWARQHTIVFKQPLISFQEAQNCQHKFP